MQIDLRAFYQSPEWKALRRLTLRRDHYRCVICGASVAGRGQSRVDHILPVRDRPDLRLTLYNTRTLCPTCDNIRHGKRNEPERQHIDFDANGYPPSWR